MSVFVRDLLTLTFVALMALIANSSAFVWGPNMVYLIQPKRPIAQSIAYTVGRGVVLTVASGVIVWALIVMNANADQLADEIRQMANRSHPWMNVVIGLAVVFVAYRLWKRPPSMLSDRGLEVATDREARIWPAFALGITIMFANLLEFVWQILTLGGAATASRNSLLVVGLAALLWTVLGTATLWAPILLRIFVPQWSTERFTALTTRMPTVKPWAVALPVALIGVALTVAGAFGLLG